jgi:hypothetical protein
MDFAQQKKFYDADEVDNSTAVAIQSHVPSFKGKEYIESQDMDASESSGDSEDPEEEIVEDFKDGGNERDDEDFIVVGSPKPKKKQEKRIARGSSKSSASRKRKCEFCGTLETPMWRRGPTGKGTLCNACGVKWSLKFRKRAGKKPKTEKHKHDDIVPREQQRHSTRKKVPAKRLASSDSKEEQSPQDSTGFCCAHSPHSTRKRSSVDDFEEPISKRRRESSLGSGDEDSMSEGDDAASNRLLGRLLNVVEVQLVEMKQIELVRRQISDLRSELHSKEQLRQRQLEQQKTETLHELATFRQKMECVTSPLADGSYQRLADTGSQVILDFIKSIRHQMEEIRSTLGISVNNGLGKKLDFFQSELDALQAKMDANFSATKAKAANDALSMDKMLSAKESTIR